METVLATASQDHTEQEQRQLDAEGKSGAPRDASGKSKKTPSERPQTKPGSQKKAPGNQKKTPGNQKKTLSSQRKTPSSQKKTPSSQKKTPSNQKKAADGQYKAKSAPGKNQMLGKLGEDLASVYLQENGFSILERNWRCDAGEADIIAIEKDILVFIEVKTRSGAYQGLPEYAVTAQRRARYEIIAINYLRARQRPSGQVRFDVIAVCMTGKQQCLLRHHRDAFGAE